MTQSGGWAYLAVFALMALASCGPGGPPALRRRARCSRWAVLMLAR